MNIALGPLGLPKALVGLSLRALLAGVLLPAFAGPLLCVGDSLTEQIGATGGFRFIEQFATNTGKSVTNLGHSGQTIKQLFDNYYVSEVRALRATSDTIHFLAGTNSFGKTPFPDDLAVRADLIQYVNAAKADGFKILVGTITPRSFEWDATKEAYRLAYNAWLRANWRSLGIDGLIDYALIPELQSPGNAFFMPDGLHPTAQGSRRMAELLRAGFGFALVQDETPNAFTLADVGNATVSTQYTTSLARLSGFNNAVPFTATAGGEISVNGGPWLASQTVQPWDQFQVRVTSSAASGTAKDILVTAGQTSDTWTVTTALPLASFNTTPKAGAGTFSNSNRSVITTVLAAHVLTDNAIVGKKVFAITVDAGAESNNFMFGISDGDPSATGPGWDNHSVAARQNGQIVGNGAAASTGPTMANGETIGIAVDATLRRAFWTKNGTAWFGFNFAPGTYSLTDVQSGSMANGLDLSPFFTGGEAIYGAFGGTAASGKQATLLTAWPWTMPTGFSLL